MNTKPKFLMMLLLMLAAGVNCAWADEPVGELVGAKDNTTGYNGASSTSVSVGISEKLHYEFTNYTNGSKNYYNWLLFVSGVSGVTDPIVLRADNYWFSGEYNPDNPLPNDKVNTYTHTENIDWAAFRTNMDGAKVSIDIYNYGWWVIIRTSAANNGATYSQVMKLTHDNSGAISAHLSVEYSHLVITESTVSAVSAQLYNFAGATTFDTRLFEGVGGGTGSWQFRSDGYYNGTSGTRQFLIKELYNGDQVVVSYSGSSATFKSTNAKTNSGEFVSGDLVISDESYYITANGTLELNIPRYLTIYSVEITRETNTNPDITLSTSNSTLTVGQTLQTVVGSTTPTQATPAYTSDDTTVATVDQYGKVTAVGVGTATITATLTVGNSSTSASYVVTVNSVTTSTYGYDFQQFTANPSSSVEVPTDGTGKINEISVTKLASSSYVFSTGTEPGITFHVTGTVSANGGWARHRSGGSDNPVYGLFNGNGTTQGLFIQNLRNGDKLIVEYYPTDVTSPIVILSANISQQNGGNYERVATGTTIVSGSQYCVTSDGYVRLRVRQNVYIKTIQIVREESPALSFSPSSLSYELTDLDFTEPVLITQPAGVGVTYQSLDETIAKIHDPNIHDVMFIKPGVVTIRATAVINGTPYPADYTVTVKASDAIMTMNGDYTTLFPDNNPYSNQDNTGVLASNATKVTTVPFMTMTFGNGSNTVLVEDFSNTKASMIIDSDGWQNMTYSVSDGRVVPQQGTFYKFEPAIDGQLTVSGVKRNGRNNSVVLVDMDGTEASDHSNVIFAENKTGSYTLTAGSGAIEAGTTENMVDANDASTVIATLTYGVTGGEDFSSPSSDSHVTGYTAYTAGNGVNGEPNTGTVYIIRPNYSGEIEVGVVLNAKKNFYILEDGVALPNFNPKTVNEKYYGTYKFAATAGKTYRIYCTGSKLGFYGFKFTPIRSYPVVKTYSFSDSDNAMSEEAVQLTGGHTYYLYGNTTATNGGDYQTFYLHSFTYTTDFKFPYKGVVMDGGSGVVAPGYKHVAVSTTYTATASSGVTYTLKYKDKDGNDQATAATIDSSTGQISGISKAGSYVVTASVKANDKTYKTYYVLTVPYTLPTESTDRISWKFNRTNDVSPMEQNEALNTNADEWAVYYKVRSYDKTTRALTYINVPVRANGINMAGDNARYFDNTSGLLFKANAHEFGTTADEPAGKTTLQEKLNCQPSELTNYNYVTIYNGTSMTIPNLKAGQYVRVKWSRYSPNNGDQVTLTNVTDLNDTDMNGVSISVGAGGRVSDNGGTGYHEFKVKADGDVTFTASQDGWINIYEVDVANQFIPTDLRLQTVDESSSHPSTMNYYRKAATGDAISDTYATAYGRALCQSNVSLTYSLKEGSRTGTLDDNSKCTITSNTLSLANSGHGRFTVLQEGRVGTYLLDRNEYEIKVYEYDYTPKTYPYTWNLMHVTTETGNTTVEKLTNDADLTNSTTAHQYKYWAANNDNTEFTMDLSNPENLMDWNYKTTINGTPVAIPELAGLGIHPQDLGDVAKNSIVFKAGNGGQGVVLSSTAETPKPQILTVPSVLSGQTAYLAVSGDGTVSVGDVVQTPARTVDGNKIYEVAGSGGNIDFAITNMTVRQVAVSVDTKTVYDAGYATEARSYPLDFTLAQTLLDREQKAYIVTVASNGKVVAQEVKYIPANNGVMITGTAGSTTSWPLFTTDVNRVSSPMTGNLLVGVVDNRTMGIVDWKTGSNYNYVLAAGGWVIDYETSDFENTTGTKIGEVKGVGFYLVTKSGTKINGTPYTGDKPNSNSAYLQLPALYATHQGVETESPSGVRQFFFIDFGDEATAIKAVGTGVPADARIPDNSFYTLQGVRVDNPGKGVYIHNGKMIVIK